ncbi:excisionase family DNA binding protein [Streptacidiphilus sp. MAP12-16]|uniref:helix-turn-helix domain-containing protein n=1 Tax=Streptacidiphilus sp. MAP12-16 TaxID=3156300 RepID=UPI003516C478
MPQAPGPGSAIEPDPPESHTGTVTAPHPEQLLLTPEQAGLLLQVPGSWLRKQAAAGRMSSVLLGRRLLFARTDLDALVDSHRRPATTGPRRPRPGP